MPIDIASNAARGPSSVASLDRGRQLILRLLACAMLCGAASRSIAQDFRVYTTVSQHGPHSPDWDLMSRSLTLFHTGKVYDYVEAIGEVVIFDPLQSRFVILSLNGNEMATEVRFEELHQFLKVARTEMAKYMEELRVEGSPAALRAMESLAFQANPQFSRGYEPSTGQLRLSSEFLTYTVRTNTVDQPLIVQQYLQWADWTARLNFVLHPQAVAPEVRLALNTELRETERLPTQVELKLSLDGNTSLRAKHEFQPKLLPYDRDSISRWERQRSAEGVRWVNFREYQRVLMTANGKPTASK